MADDKNLTQVNAAAAVAAADILPVVQTGTALRRATVQQLMDFVAPRYATRAAAIAASINPNVQTIILNGYHTEGDKGAGAVYRSVADTGTLRAWQFRSNANSRRWELVANVANQWLFGARGWDGTSAGFASAPDDQPAFQALADYCADTGASFWATGGHHRVNSSIIARPGPVPDPDYNFFERGPTWTFDNACVIRAGAAMEAIFQVGNHGFDNIVRDGLIQGGLFHQNNLAVRGVWVTFLIKCSIKSSQACDIPQNGCGFQGGTTILNEFGTLVASSALINIECKTEGRVRNDAGVTGSARAGTAGIRYVNCTDNQTFKNELRGIKVGIQAADVTSGWNGKHVANHVWNLPTGDQVNDMMTAGFELWGDNSLIGNQHDGPFLYCEILRGPRNVIIGRGVNYGLLNSDVDNVAFLTRLEVDAGSGSTGGATVDLSMVSAQPSKRIAGEVSLGPGVAVPNYRKGTNNRLFNVVTFAPTNSGIAASCAATMTGTTGAATLGDDAQNIASATFGSAGALNVQFLRPVGTNTPIIVMQRAGPPWNGLIVREDQTQRTPTQAVFFFTDAAGTLTTPSGFSLLAAAGGAI